ncbi:MAG TPA: class I SAM-dependent methyltransferase [Vicinamibacterales bacterium]|nr:class I SAM-dependent methyltransferase [Vicinamibacterales bacterium]
MIARAAFVDSGSCWVCGGYTASLVHESAFELSAYQDQDPDLASYTGSRVRLRRCVDCGFAQPAEIPALPRFFDRLYQQLWPSEWVAEEFRSTSKDRIFSCVLDGLRRRLPDGRRLLDVGAHAGRFLFLARRAGWDAEGIEVNPRTAAFAAGNSGARVLTASAWSLATIHERYDAVTLTDVLEHIPDPVALLLRVREVVAPEGWIAVKVPCGPAQRIKEHLRSWLHPGYRPRLADNLVHVNHFSRRALRLALVRAGFDSISLDVGVPERPPDAPLGNAVRLGLYRVARALPSGTSTPLAFNLQAFARRPAAMGNGQRD